MSLEEQLLSLLFSFIYGIVIAYLFNLFYSFLNYKDKKYKLLINVLFFLLIFVVYFLLLQRINSGIIHIYFLGMLFLGFILFYKKID